jgi:hypothetical protein
VSDTTFGVRSKKQIFGLEGSQPVPASSSARGKAYDQKILNLSTSLKNKPSLSNISGQYYHCGSNYVSCISDLKCL